MRRKAVSSPGKGKYQDDEYLLALLATNLDQHFADLVSIYEDRLTAHALYTLRSLQDAEEVVQDTFERVYYALKGKGYSEQHIRTLKLRAWLYTITHNLCCNVLLKRSKSPTLVSLSVSEEDSSPLEIEADCSEQPEVAYEKKECIHEIEQAVQALPEFCREMVRLRILEHFSYREIADLLNQPIGSVKCYISRGKAMLREILKEWDHQSDDE
jgi:RNA polymerase sigma-70 factor, ECF subfamily